MEASKIQWDQKISAKISEALVSFSYSSNDMHDFSKIAQVDVDSIIKCITKWKLDIDHVCNTIFDLCLSQAVALLVKFIHSLYDKKSKLYGKYLYDNLKSYKLKCIDNYTEVGSYRNGELTDTFYFKNSSWTILSGVGGMVGQQKFKKFVVQEYLLPQYAELIQLVFFLLIHVETI
jgi:hypothetical protein